MRTHDLAGWPRPRPSSGLEKKPVRHSLQAPPPAGHCLLSHDGGLRAGPPRFQLPILTARHSCHPAGMRLFIRRHMARFGNGFRLIIVRPDCRLARFPLRSAVQIESQTVLRENTSWPARQDGRRAGICTPASASPFFPKLQCVYLRWLPAGDKHPPVLVSAQFRPGFYIAPFPSDLFLPVLTKSEYVFWKKSCFAS